MRLKRGGPLRSLGTPNAYFKLILALGRQGLKTLQKSSKVATIFVNWKFCITFAQFLGAI
jgi:hypothetical protein